MYYVLASLVVAAAATPKDERSEEIWLTFFYSWLTSLIKIINPFKFIQADEVIKFIRVAMIGSPVTFMVIVTVVAILGTRYLNVRAARKNTFPLETFAKLHYPPLLAAYGVRAMLEDEQHFQECLLHSKLKPAERKKLGKIREDKLAEILTAPTSMAVDVPASLTPLATSASPLGTATPLGGAPSTPLGAMPGRRRGARSLSPNSGRPSRSRPSLGFHPVFPEELNKFKITPRWFVLFAVVPFVALIEHGQAICSNTDLCSEEDLVKVCQNSWISPMRNLSARLLPNHLHGFCTTIAILEAAQNDEIADLKEKLDFVVAKFDETEAMAAEVVAIVEKREWVKIDKRATEFDAIVQAPVGDEQIEIQWELEKSKLDKGAKAKIKIGLGAKAREDKIAHLKEKLGPAIKKTLGAQIALLTSIQDARKVREEAKEAEKMQNEDMDATLQASKNVRTAVGVVMTRARHDLTYQFLMEVVPASLSKKPKTCPQSFYDETKEKEDAAVSQWNKFYEDFSVKYLSLFRDGTNHYAEGCNFLVKFLEETTNVVDAVDRKWREPETLVADKLQFSNEEFARLQSLLELGLSKYEKALEEFAQLEVEFVDGTLLANKNQRQADRLFRLAVLHKGMEGEGWSPIWGKEQKGNVAGSALLKKLPAESQTRCEKECWSELTCWHIAFQEKQTYVSRPRKEATWDYWTWSYQGEQAAEYGTTPPSCKLFEGQLELDEAGTHSSLVVRALQAPKENARYTNQDLTEMIHNLELVEQRWEGIKLPLRTMSVVVEVYHKACDSLIKALQALQIKLPKHKDAEKIVETKFDTSALQKLTQSIHKLITDEVSEIEAIVIMGQHQISDLYTQMKKNKENEKIGGWENDKNMKNKENDNEKFNP